MSILIYGAEASHELYLRAGSASVLETWMRLLAPPNDGTYPPWACPKVIHVKERGPFPGRAGHADDLPLEAGDVLDVVKDLAGGWYHGRLVKNIFTKTVMGRKRRGDFPRQYVKEIPSPFQEMRRAQQASKDGHWSGAYK